MQMLVCFCFYIQSESPAVRDAPSRREFNKSALSKPYFLLITICTESGDMANINT